MQVNLEIAVHDAPDEPIANVICNAVPRVGEGIVLLAGESDPASGEYKVTWVLHMLDPRRIETVQHVCIRVRKVDKQ